MRVSRLELFYCLVFVIAISMAWMRLPAYASRLPWLMVVAVADLYWFGRLARPLISKVGTARKLLIILGLMPSVMLLVFFFSMAFLSPVDWNPVIRTYLFGTAIFLYILRTPPLLVFLFSDLKSLLLNKHSTKNKELHKSLWFKISLALSLFAALIMALGMTLWVYDFQVVEEKIQINGLPQAFEGYRIAHISDLHLGRLHSDKPLQDAVEMVNSLQPDLIAFTGDLVNYSTSEAWPYRKLLSELKAKDGVYAVLGNHDYGDYMCWPSEEAKHANIEAMFTLIDELGWVLLENRHITLDRNGHCLTFSGTGHYSTKAYIPNRADFEQTFLGLPDSCSLILLTHTPEALGSDGLMDHKIDLILSGHTHALQLGFHFGGKAYSPAAMVYKYWGGLYEPDESNCECRYLYVNRGLGHIAFPLRLGMKPEITLLTLTRE